VSRDKLAWNMAANTAGVVVNMLTGLLVMPFLIQEIGASTYGLWSLIGSLTGYLGVLDFGVRPAVGRLIAGYRARGELEQINIVSSTAAALLSAVGVIVLLATALAINLFPLIFTVPPERASDVNTSLMLVGLTVAVSFPSSVIDGFLWGYERFDVLSAIDAATVLLRTVLIFCFVRDAAPLATLASIVFAVSLFSAVLKGFICFRVERGFRVSLRHCRKSKVREIYSYGSWMSLITWSKSLTPQIVLAIIGHALGTAAVTSFAVGRQLVTYSDIFTNAATQVMAPRAIAAHAIQAIDTQRRLLLKGSEFALALTLYFAGGLVCLGLPFIHRWQHGSQDGSYRLMVVLLLGQLLPMSQWLTYSILVGSNRHRLVGALAVGELVAAASLSAICVRFSGLLGVCMAVACAGFFTRGVLQMVAGCRLLNVRVGAYARLVFGPIIFAAIPSILALWASTYLIAPRTFLTIGMLGAGYTVLFALIVGVRLLGLSDFKRIIRLAIPRFARLG